MNMRPFINSIDFKEKNILYSADVLITDSKNYAVALKYDESICDAPFVVAKGIGNSVVDLEELAKKSKVTVFASPFAMELYLFAPIVGKEIPETMFENVATVLAYVYKYGKHLS